MTLNNTTRVLRWLVSHPGAHTIKHIARELGLHYMSVWREIVRLDETGLIYSEQDGFRMRRWGLIDKEHQFKKAGAS